MAIKIILGIFFLFFGCALSQYETMYRPNTVDMTYDQTRQEIISNFLNNKPLLNYLPVYNTEYSSWEEGNSKTETNPIKTAPPTHPDLDFDKFGEVITRLKTNMQNLGQKTKHIYEGKLKELGELKKIYDNLKIVLQNADTLKNSLHENKKHLVEFSRNPQNVDRFSSANFAGVEKFLKSMEGLESMVRNINYKYDEKPKM